MPGRQVWIESLEIGDDFLNVHDRQASLDGVSGDLFDDFENDPLGASMAPALDPITEAPLQKAGKAQKGRQRNTGGVARYSTIVELDAAGVPQRPTFLLKMDPVRPPAFLSV